MIDTAAIFFSTLMCLIVAFRAIKLDGQLPWFGTRKPRATTLRDGEERPGAP
jgi:hypothetical protein